MTDDEQKMFHPPDWFRGLAGVFVKLPGSCPFHTGLGEMSILAIKIKDDQDEYETTHKRKVPLQQTPTSAH